MEVNQIFATDRSLSILVSKILNCEMQSMRENENTNHSSLKGQQGSPTCTKVHFHSDPRLNKLPKDQRNKTRAATSSAEKNRAQKEFAEIMSRVQDDPLRELARLISEVQVMDDSLKESVQALLESLEINAKKKKKAGKSRATRKKKSLNRSQRQREPSSSSCLNEISSNILERIPEFEETETIQVEDAGSVQSDATAITQGLTECSSLESTKQMNKQTVRVVKVPMEESSSKDQNEDEIMSSQRRTPKRNDVFTNLYNKSLKKQMEGKQRRQAISLSRAKANQIPCFSGWTIPLSQADNIYYRSIRKVVENDKKRAAVAKRRNELYHPRFKFNVRE